MAGGKAQRCPGRCCERWGFADHADQRCASVPDGARRRQPPYRREQASQNHARSFSRRLQAFSVLSPFSLITRSFLALTRILRFPQTLLFFAVDASNRHGNINRKFRQKSGYP